MDWKPIREAPDDFQRPGGQRTVRVRDDSGREFTARRAYFNNSGWLEVGTNRELWPVSFDLASIAPDDAPPTSASQ